MSYARNNPNTMTIAAVAVFAAGGLWWWKKRKSAQDEKLDELMVIDDYATGVSIDEVTTASGAEWLEDGSSGWVEEDSSAATAALPSKAGPEAAAVLSDPDPSPAKEKKRGQTAIKLTKSYMIASSKNPLKPTKYRWKTKRVKGKGRFVLATRKSDGTQFRFAVKKDGKVVRLKKVVA